MDIFFNNFTGRTPFLFNYILFAMIYYCASVRAFIIFLIFSLFKKAYLSVQFRLFEYRQVIRIPESEMS